MSAPQMKERPSVLRAMFSSLSSLFTGKDRAKTAAPPPAPTSAGSKATKTTPFPEAKAEPEAVVIETETEVVAVEADPVTGEPEIVVETDIVMLPLANYDTLTVASLRARLRNLSVEQLTELLDYEKAHAARPEVISMFERRIAKVQSEA